MPGLADLITNSSMTFARLSVVVESSCCDRWGVTRGPVNSLAAVLFTVVGPARVPGQPISTGRVLEFLLPYLELYTIIILFL